MKKLFLVIGLKIVEIGGAVFTYYLLCRLWQYLYTSVSIPFAPFWFGGILTIGVLLIIFGCCFILSTILYNFVLFNLELADKILKR